MWHKVRLCFFVSPKYRNRQNCAGKRNIQAKAPVKMFATAQAAIRTVAGGAGRAACPELLHITFMANPDKIEKKWYVVDATDCTLGRLASEVAKVLRGKNKPEFTPHVDTGDYVIVVNAEKIKVTGKKLDQKIYYRHSEYVGGMKEATLRELLAKKPERVIELAVKGMLPKGPLGRAMLTKLHVYAGAEHPHAAQKPEVLTF